MIRVAGGHCRATPSLKQHEKEPKTHGIRHWGRDINHKIRLIRSSCYDDNGDTMNIEASSHYEGSLGFNQIPSAANPSI
jgi:hypothetical protein